MSKLVWIALCGLVLAGCASDNRYPSASGGSSATAPGDEGDRERSRGSSAPSSAPRTTY